MLCPLLPLFLLISNFFFVPFNEAGWGQARGAAVSQMNYFSPHTRSKAGSSGSSLIWAASSGSVLCGFSMEGAGERLGWKGRAETWQEESWEKDFGSSPVGKKAKRNLGGTWSRRVGTWGRFGDAPNLTVQTLPWGRGRAPGLMWKGPAALPGLSWRQRALIMGK